MGFYDITPTIKCGFDNIHPKFPNSSTQNRVLEYEVKVFFTKLQSLLVGSSKQKLQCLLVELSKHESMRCYSKGNNNLKCNYLYVAIKLWSISSYILNTLWNKDGSLQLFF